MRKTRKEIIDETAAAYTSSTRSTDGEGGCLYVGDGGRMCAVGRCLADASAVSRSLEYQSAHDVILKLGDSVFKEEYRGHPSGFWSDLQLLHDDDDAWCDSGLTDDGVDYIAELHAKWDEQP